VKYLPVKWMLKYSTQNCEVGGLHPMYKDPQSLQGKTVVYCPTPRSGESCHAVVKAFEQAGARIKTMSAEFHDRNIQSTAQNDRVYFFAAYALLLQDLQKKGIGFKEFYDLSPPPTKALLDLIARQVDSSNDELYASMQKYNPFQSRSNSRLISNLIRVFKGEYNPQQIREIMGEHLSELQSKAAQIVKIS